MSRVTSAPGFFGARSANVPGAIEWREAAQGDLVLDLLLRGEFDAVNKALDRHDIGDSPRAILRRDLLRFALSTLGTNGTVFHIQNLQLAREIIDRDRGLLESGKLDDPIYLSGVEFVTAPLFRAPEPHSGDTDADRIVEAAQYDYFRDLYAAEYDWAISRLPQQVTQQLTALSTATTIDEQARQMTSLDATGAASGGAEYFPNYRRSLDAMQGATTRRLRYAKLIADGQLDALSSEVSGARSAQRGAVIWDVLSALESDILGEVMSAMATDANDRARRFNLISTRVQTLTNLCIRSAASLPRVSRSIVVERTDRARALLGVLRVLVEGAAVGDVHAGFDHFRRAAAATGMQNLQVLRFLPRFSELLDRHPPSLVAALTALTHDALPKDNSDGAVATHVALAFVVLDEASRSPTAIVSRPFVDEMWSLYGVNGAYANYWPGVFVTRGLLLLAHDSRVHQIDLSALNAVGGDPPWLLVMLHRRRIDDNIARPENVRTRQWLSIVSNYANP
jgi:hypothetical protein